MKRIIAILLFSLLLFPLVGHAQVSIGWTDTNDPHADNYILLCSEHPDTGFSILDFVTPLEGTHEYMYTDTTIAEGIPTYYRVMAVRDLSPSELSPWVRALWKDKSEGTYLYYAYQYWPNMDKRNMLLIYTPIEHCNLFWKFQYPFGDLIAVQCSPFMGTVPTPELEPCPR